MGEKAEEEEGGVRESVPYMPSIIASGERRARRRRSSVAIGGGGGWTMAAHSLLSYSCLSLSPSILPFVRGAQYPRPGTEKSQKLLLDTRARPTGGKRGFSFFPSSFGLLDGVSRARHAIFTLEDATDGIDRTAKLEPRRDLSREDRGGGGKRIGKGDLGCSAGGGI